MESIDRRRFLGNATVLTAAAFGANGGPSNENGWLEDLDGPDPDGRLAACARAGLARRWGGAPPLVHRARLESELGVICERRASRQFLAAAEVARFARGRDIMVGPGRGAAPGSLVAHALGITGVDPLAHGLIFQRFLNARAATLPSICLDVCPRRWPEVVDFAAARLGGTPTLAGDSTALPELGLEISPLPVLGDLRAALARLAQNGARVDLAAVPLDDPAAHERLASGQAIPLFGADFGPMLRAVRVERFEEVIAAIALCRPGPRRVGLSDQLVLLKQGRSVLAPEHPLLEPALASTRGLVIYQEQIMQIAVAVARYSLDDADLLRRRLARGHAEAVDRERDRFVLGAIGAGVPWPDAVRVFARLEASAPLAFNRSHAVPCALLVYWAAYLEAHHPSALAADSP